MAKQAQNRPNPSRPSRRPNHPPVPQSNSDLQNVYFFLNYDAKEQNYRIVFRADDSRFLIRYGFYNQHRYHQPLAEWCPWFFRMRCIYFVGPVRDHNELDDKIRTMKFAFGPHLISSSLSSMAMFTLYRHSHSQTHFMGCSPICDVYPKFRDIRSDVRPQSWQCSVGLMISSPRYRRQGWLTDGGRCGIFADGSMRALHEDNHAEYLTVPYSGHYFTLYVCDGAKLVVVNGCRHCERTGRETRHYDRSLLQHGALVVCQGKLLFNFCSESQDFFTAEELENRGSARMRQISGRQHPIYFVRAMADTSCLVLSEINQSHGGARYQWCLDMPDYTEFETVLDYNDGGIDEVIARQCLQPWHDNVEPPPGFVYELNEGAANVVNVWGLENRILNHDRTVVVDLRPHDWHMVSPPGVQFGPIEELYNGNRENEVALYKTRVAFSTEINTGMNTPNKCRVYLEPRFIGRFYLNRYVRLIGEWWVTDGFNEEFVEMRRVQHSERLPNFVPSDPNIRALPVDDRNHYFEYWRFDTKDEFIYVPVFYCVRHGLGKSF